MCLMGVGKKEQYIANEERITEAKITGYTCSNELKGA